MRVVQDRIVARAYDDINCVAHALNTKNREYPQDNSVPIKGEYGTRRVNSEHNPVVVLVKDGHQSCSWVKHVQNPNHRAESNMVVPMNLERETMIRTESNKSTCAKQR